MLLFGTENLKMRNAHTLFQQLSAGIEHAWPESKKLKDFTVRLQCPSHMTCQENFGNIYHIRIRCRRLAVPQPHNDCRCRGRQLQLQLQRPQLLGRPVTRYMKLAHLFGGIEVGSASGRLARPESGGPAVTFKGPWRAAAIRDYWLQRS